MPPLPTLFDLSSRVAVITGGAGLLGTEFCRTLSAAGASVVVADIDINGAQSVADSITRDFSAPNKNPSVAAIQTDVTDKSSAKDMVDETIRQFGRLDILVNSAVLDPKFDPTHGGHVNAFEDFPLDAWNQAIEVNLTGAFLSSQAAVVPMLKQRKGVIINLSSIYGITGPDQRLYVQAYSARTVLGRMADKGDMNGALLFLASDASSYMTGANLVVDGGWSVW
jgi:2-deoxy-D-gluconate 3-dehydrogenase